MDRILKCWYETDMEFCSEQGLIGLHGQKLDFSWFICQIMDKGWGCLPKFVNFDTGLIKCIFWLKYRFFFQKPGLSTLPMNKYIIKMLYLIIILIVKRRKLNLNSSYSSLEKSRSIYLEDFIARQRGKPVSGWRK